MDTGVAALCETVSGAISPAPKWTSQAILDAVTVTALWASGLISGLLSGLA